MREKDSGKFLQITDFVNAYYSDNGRSPSTREIESGTGISRPTVQRYLLAMRERGEIDYDGHRNIITDFIRELQASSSQRVAIVGSIPCGEPEEPFDSGIEYVRLPVALTGNGEFYLLRASGNSMVEVGIDDGDLVLIRKQNTANEGQIIAALTDGAKTTLKRYYPKKDCVVLHPENKSLDDIVVSGSDLNYFRIQGVAIKVIKDLV